MSIIKNGRKEIATVVLSQIDIHKNYGGVVRNCVNNASVSGYSYVGGIAGLSRDYTTDQASSYIIGCKNTGNIIGTSSTIGGIAAYILCDEANHNNSESVIVACYSTATVISGTSLIGLIGGLERSGRIYGSWAYKTASVSKVIGKINNNQPKACYAFDSAAAITEADVDAMNAAIADYNVGKSAGDYNYCPYTWRYVAGGSPVLQ